MPCRALEAFRRGVAGDFYPHLLILVLMPCRALEAFRLPPTSPAAWRRTCSLNALSGIGGVQTKVHGLADGGDNNVLMPCRALEAFRPKAGPVGMAAQQVRLNALSGIGGVQTHPVRLLLRAGDGS